MTLKNELFNRETVTILAKIIKEVYSDFEYDKFINDSVDSFPPLELKERMTSVRKQLRTHLPDNYIDAIDILTKAMKIRTSGGFIFGSVLEYPEAYGCTDEHFKLSLDKLAEWTSSLSSEFAIRPFLDNYPEETMKEVMKWTKDEDVHIRRLASEGTRPSLPWGPNITMDYKTAAQPLDFLYFDKERYVTRSVANHLNDISKIDPDFVLAKLNKWRKEGKQNKEELDYMIKHSLRTLVKKGHMDTLEFLGYKNNPDISVSNLIFDQDEINIGDLLEFEFELHSNDNCKVVIDYKVIYPSTTSVIPQKIYKLKNFEIEKGKTYKIKGRKRFNNMSTRKMRQGIHKVEFQINGTVVLEKTFNLK